MSLHEVTMGIKVTMLLLVIRNHDDGQEIETVDASRNRMSCRPLQEE